MTWLKRSTCACRGVELRVAVAVDGAHHDAIASIASVVAPSAPRVRCMPEAADTARRRPVEGGDGCQTRPRSRPASVSGMGAASVPAPRRRLTGSWGAVTQRRARPPRRRGPRSRGHGSARGPSRSLPLGREVVTEEDRVGHMQREPLEGAQVHLPTTGDADLPSGQTKRAIARILRQRAGTAPTCPRVGCRRRA